MANPKVFFDISIGGKAAGRVNMNLFADVVVSAGAPGCGGAHCRGGRAGRRARA